MNALEAAVKVGAGRFVYASSEAVLGFAYRTVDFAPEYFPIDENHPLLPQDTYGAGKIAAEEICRAYTRSGAITTACLRPCYCWGPSLGQEAVQAIEHPELHHRSLWVYIHLKDIARAYRLACEHPTLVHETALHRCERRPHGGPDRGPDRTVLPGRPAHEIPRRVRRVDR